MVDGIFCIYFALWQWRQGLHDNLRLSLLPVGVAGSVCVWLVLDSWPTYGEKYVCNIHDFLGYLGTKHYKGGIFVKNHSW